VVLQEIVGLGLANFAGSAFNAYSTTGSFSRSAVNYDSGERDHHMQEYTKSSGFCVCVRSAFWGHRCMKAESRGAHVWQQQVHTSSNVA